MEVTTLESAIKSIKKGSFVDLTWTKQLKSRKENPINVYKVSNGVVRLGIAYDNSKAVKEKREKGEIPKENQGLNGCEWLMYPYILKGKTSNQLRVYTIPNSAISAKYYAEGKEITKEDAEKLCLKSEFSSRTGDLECFNVKVDNIQKIQGKEVM